MTEKYRYFCKVCGQTIDKNERGWEMKYPVRHQECLKQLDPKILEEYRELLRDSGELFALFVKARLSKILKNLEIIKDVK